MKTYEINEQVYDNIIKADKYNSLTIPLLIDELKKDRHIIEIMQSRGFSGDWLEAVATHIITTDTDFYIVEA